MRSCEQRSARTFSLHFVLPLAILVTACGRTESNKNIPKVYSDITTDDIEDNAFRRATARWNALQAELGLLRENEPQPLETPSQKLETSALQSIASAIANEHVRTYQRATCAEVVSFEALGSTQQFNLDSFALTDLSGARRYLMKYKRRTDSGETDSTVHGAIVTAPDAASTFPVIAYAHAGDEGLSQLELAAVLGPEQLNYIVVAPAYPGEAIYEPSLLSRVETFAAVGKSEPYSTDAEDLLAAHDCVLQAGNVPASLLTIQGKIKTRTAGPAVGTAVTGTIGVSRGGMASLIALAKNEAYSKANKSNAKHFSCAATAINPTTFFFGEFRVFLEAVVRGTAEGTSFLTLPTAPQLNELLKDFRDDRPQATVSQTALELQKRDATFNSPLFMSALRNWSTGGRGSFLMMHGTLDQKIPYSQALIGGKVFTQVNAWLPTLTGNDVAPGVHLSALGFTPNSTYASDANTLRTGSTMHGDRAWFSSAALFNTARLEPAGSAAIRKRTINIDNIAQMAQQIPSGSFGSGKAPLNVLWDWLKDTSIGCVAAQ